MPIEIRSQDLAGGWTYKIYRQYAVAPRVWLFVSGWLSGIITGLVLACLLATLIGCAPRDRCEIYEWSTGTPRCATY